MDIREEVRAAGRRIAPYARRTPVEFSPWLSRQGHCRVHLKLENHQLTGSFKFRGAMNCLLAMPAEQRRRGVVAASTGNHGAAVARGAALLEVKATIFAPTTAQAGKLAAIREAGAEVRGAGADCIEAEVAARQFAADQGLPYLSPYNDPQVIAGQGTVALELEEQLAALDAVIVAVGGGGLVAGIGGYLAGGDRPVTIVGASPEHSAVMQASLAAGEILDLESLPTLSDATAGGIEPGSITFDRCRQVIDDFVLVSEVAIASAMQEMITRHHMLIEGAAGVAVAAFLACGDRFAGQDVAIVVCGGNLDIAVLRQIL